MINFTIILADDEQQILYGMKNGIDWESLGFSVVGTAQNGKEALELIEEHHPDLLISDIKMPFMDGLELSKTIHENYINTKIILFSGWDDFEYARTAISYGVSQYIMKPIDYNEMQKLLTTMHEELEKEYAEKMNRTRLENIYTESIPLLRQQFFTQLLTETLTEDYCTLQMKNLKLNFDYEVFHIITVKIRENDLNDVLSELSIKETIKESLEKITDLYHFGMIDREVFFLCGNKKHDIERITRTIQEASVIIERIFHTKISCGISSSGTSLRALPVLYQQALEALDYNVVIQDESYTYYNDILPLQKDAPLQKDDDWNSEVDSIEKIITHCSEEELKTAVLNMLEHLHEAHYNLNEYQIVILEISFSLARLYKKYQITSDKEFAGSKKMAVKILSLNTGEELDNWLINYFQLMRTLIQKKQVDNNVILAENAKKLVEEHFREPDLSVESICKELHVSSSYFSKIFKQETETTFLNYLIRRRMEEAKMLLKMTDYKSHVIGTMVGYPEPNYFILDVWHEKSLSSNELSSIIANEEQNHAIGILLIYPENYLTQQEKHYDYNNVLAITATMQTAFSHYAAFENSPSSSYLLPVSAQVIKKIQDGKTDCIYIKNTYELGYESIQMLDTYSRNKYMKDISIPCHKVDKAAIESGELDALLTN